MITAEMALVHQLCRTPQLGLPAGGAIGKERVQALTTMTVNNLLLCL